MSFVAYSPGGMRGLGACYDASSGAASPWRYVMSVQKDPATLTTYHYAADGHLLMTTSGRGYITVVDPNLPADMLAEIACVNQNQSNADATSKVIPGAIAPGPVPADYVPPTSIPMPGANAGGNPSTPLPVSPSPSTSNYVASGESFFDSSFDVAGYNIPVWGLLVGGFAALYLLGRGR